MSVKKTTRIPKRKLLQYIYNYFELHKRWDVFSKEYFLLLPYFQIKGVGKELRIIIRNKYLPIYLQYKRTNPHKFIIKPLNYSTNSKLIEWVKEEIEKNGDKINKIPKPSTIKQKKDCLDVLLDRLELLQNT